MNSNKETPKTERTHCIKNAGSNKGARNLSYSLTSKIYQFCLVFQRTKMVFCLF